MSIKKYVISVCLVMISAGSFAHGLMESPASRNWFCGGVTKPDEVANGVAKYPQCGTAFAVNSIAGYSFMSVLTHNLGVSVVSPLPTNVCSADSETWQGAVTPWDVPMDWPTNPISAGPQNIVWNISWGPHFSDTLEFRYWITKSDFVFSPTKALSWSDFEATPFCVLPYDDTNPTGNPNVVPDKATAHFTTTCTMPARTGHHVVYGEWGRQPVTYERFHGCVDVAYGAVTNPVVAAISATPSATTVTGATTIALNAAGSTGANLSYQWAIESPNTALYSLSSATAASTTLTLQAPAAQTSFTVRLTVSSGTSSNSTTIVFTHFPTGVADWADFGALTATARTLAVGDKVRVRSVDVNGTDTYFPTTPLTITSANTASTAWPYALAQAINTVNSKIRVGVLASNVVTPAQNATSNRIYAVTPTTYVSAFLYVESAATSSSSVASSSSSSVASSAGAAQCNWYGTLYPLCTTTASGWGWENNKNCIASVTCAAQPAPYGIVGGASSAANSSAVITSSSKSSSSVASSAVTSSSKSSVASSSVLSSSSKSSVASSSVASSVKSSSSSSVAVAGNCSYVIQGEWNSGAQANIVIKNNGTAAINGWTVSWRYSNGTTVVSYFNAQVTGTNPYTATNLAWNSTILPGQSVQFGFNATKGVVDTAAEKPAVTGVVCN